MMISARPFDWYDTSLRLKLISLFVGDFKVSASRVASSSSFSLFELRFATHARRYDSGELSPNQDATSTFASARSSYFNANLFGPFTVGFFGEIVVVVVFGGLVAIGAAVVVVGSIVVVVELRIDVVVSAGTSSSTKVVTARDDELFVESFETIALFEMPGNAWASRAARPATCGVAIDVPEIVRVADEPPTQGDVMFVPGAQRSTHDP